MNGKDKCRILKDIRRQIAENNDIEWVVSECRHHGNCKGTCPKCESEVRKLERELDIRRRLGRSVVIAGISAASIAGLTACSGSGPAGIISGIINPRPAVEDIAGYIDVVDPETEEDPTCVETLDGEVAIIDEIDLSGDVAYEDSGK